jgi:hypothetical protein
VSSWIDLHALWQIVVVGLLAGAGLPAVFAVGLRALSLPGTHALAADVNSERINSERTNSERASSEDTSSERIVGGSPVGIAAAVLCFAIVLAAVGWGIYFIVAGT